MSKLLKIYSYSKCGTCRKALQWLQDKKIKYELIDIIGSPPSKEIILQAIEQLGGVKFVLNTSGKSYREIGASSIKAMLQEEVVKLLVADSKLLKRPFLLQSKGTILVGFNQVNWEKAFSDHNYCYLIQILLYLLYLDLLIH